MIDADSFQGKGLMEAEAGAQVNGGHLHHADDLLEETAKESILLGNESPGIV